MPNFINTHHVILSYNIYIRPLSYVQNKLRFILHEPYDLSWPFRGRSLGKTCIIALRRSPFLKDKRIHLVIIFLSIWADWVEVSVIYHSTNIKLELDYILYEIETWEDNPVDTCDLCSGYEWQYQKLQKLQVIVFFVCVQV